MVEQRTSTMVSVFLKIIASPNAKKNIFVQKDSNHCEHVEIIMNMNNGLKKPFRNYLRFIKHEYFLM